jgi:ketosteroid isomerase-like protein
MSRATTVGLVLSSLLGAACGADVERDRAIVEQVVWDSIGWAQTKDRALLEGLIAHDDDLFLFQPTSAGTIVGWEEFEKQFDIWMDPRFEATDMDVRNLRVHLSPSGDVAWFSAILDDFGTWDGRPVGWEDTRWTGVLEKRDGRWLVVQMHFSFAADEPPPRTD